MKKIILSIVIGTAALDNAGAEVVIDFNSNTTGQLVGQNGTLSVGLTGTWAGSTFQNVAAGDLTSTYALAQTGTPQKFVDTLNSSAASSNTYNSLSAPATGTVYFSFLGQLSSNNGRIGLALNPSSATVPASASSPFTLLLFGSPTASPNPPGLYFRNLGGATIGTPVAVSLADQLNVQFVVGRITFTGGNDTMELWLNPDLSLGSLGAANFTNSTVDIGANLSSIGAWSYGGVGTSGGAIDNIRIGSSLGAVATPEPSTYLMLLGGLGALTLLRRRRA